MDYDNIWVSNCMKETKSDLVAVIKILSQKLSYKEKQCDYLTDRIIEADNKQQYI